MSEQAVFRAIAHPARREIIALLAAQDMSVAEVADRFQMTRPGVKKHLTILQDADLVRSEKQGRESVNRLNPTGLQPVADWLEFYSQFWDEKLASLKSVVEDNHD